MKFRSKTLFDQNSTCQINNIINYVSLQIENLGELLLEVYKSGVGAEFVVSFRTNLFKCLFLVGDKGFFRLTTSSCISTVFIDGKLE
jgi:hypothetical protein